MIRLPPAVRADWSSLAAPTRAVQPYDPAATAELPEPARRWLAHAIAPGSPLLTSVQLRMHGQIRLGAWRNFVADQHTSLTGGFVWAATARFLGLPVSGFDRYTRESAQMRWRLMGAVQVMAAEGADVTRSAAGRHAGEVLLVAPAAGLSSLVSWQPVDADRVTARIALGSTAHEVTLTVAADGALAEVVLRRWGNPDNRGFGQYTFAAELRDEATFDGYTIPRTVVAGWRCGGERWDEEQFIRYTIDDARYC